jgi:hypothetical protein
MRKYLLIFFFLAISMDLIPAYRAVTYLFSTPIYPYERLFKAICEVESGGDRLAYNKKEKAVGIAQIREIRLRDYNRHARKSYKLKDCYDIDISKEIFMFYCGGRDYETIAKEWNGSGKKTNAYWKKVKKELGITNCDSKLL